MLIEGNDAISANFYNDNGSVETKLHSQFLITEAITKEFFSMSDIPETEKQIKAKITSYKTAFNKEKKMHGWISDGYGKRYLMFPLHLVLGDGKKAKEYIEWYDNEFPDDIGEPIQQICRALIHYRLGETEQATVALAKTMLMNIYFIPQLLGEKVPELDIRHCSNLEYHDYFKYVSQRLYDNIEDEEFEWMFDTFMSAEFQDILREFIRLRKAQNNANTVEERSALFEEESALLEDWG